MPSAPARWPSGTARSCSTRSPWSASCSCSRAPTCRRSCTTRCSRSTASRSRSTCSAASPSASPTAPRRRPGELPSVAIVVPAMNEESGIGPTIDAAFAVDYPAELLSVYVVDDGSTDGTWREICKAARRHPALHALRFSCNRGKRAAMAAGIRASDADVLCFVDSDSTLAPNALQEIVRPFADPRVAIVTGHADVLNRGENLLTRLQQVRYYVAFRVVKAARVRLRRRLLRVGLLLRLPPRAAARGAGELGAPALPGPRGDVRRRPRADQRAAAQLARRLPVDRDLRDDRAGDDAPLPRAAGALEEELDARVDRRRALLLAQAPGRRSVAVLLDPVPARRPADRVPGASSGGR